MPFINGVPAPDARHGGRAGGAGGRLAADRRPPARQAAAAARASSSSGGSSRAGSGGRRCRFRSRRRPTASRCGSRPRRSATTPARIGRLVPGTRVVAEGPFGVFTDASRTREKVLLVAGGIGITPMRALIEEMEGDIVVLYRVVSEDDLVFWDELDAARRRARVPLHYVVGDHTTPEGPRAALAGPPAGNSCPMWSSARYTCVVPCHSSTCSRASSIVQASRDATFTSSDSRSEKGENGCPERRRPPSPRSGCWLFRRSARGRPCTPPKRDAEEEGRRHGDRHRAAVAVQASGATAPGRGSRSRRRPRPSARRRRSRSRSSTSTSRSKSDYTFKTEYINDSGAAAARRGRARRSRPPRSRTSPARPTPRLVHEVAPRPRSLLAKK